MAHISAGYMMLYLMIMDAIPVHIGPYFQVNDSQPYLNIHISFHVYLNKFCVFRFHINLIIQLNALSAYIYIK